MSEIGFLGLSARRVIDFAAVRVAHRTIGRSRARNLQTISEVCYLRIPRNSLLCALLTVMCISLFACGYAGTPPGFKTNPATAAPTITVGQAATFSVTASGDAPMNYQWFMNGAAAGTNSSAFSIAQTATGQTGAQIFVVVTNAGGSATSATVTLTVTAAATAPMITQQPVSMTVTAGQSAAFSVMATGTAPLTYQWFMNGTAVGTNSSTFSIAQTTAGQTGAQIQVKVSNPTGSATSNTVALTVNPVAPTAPAISQQPTNATVTV